MILPPAPGSMGKGKALKNGTFCFKGCGSFSVNPGGLSGPI